MNPNDILASIAGLTTETEVEEIEDFQEVDEEVSYDEVETELLDSFEAESNGQGRCRRSRVAQRELQGLQFINPGDEMSRFLPDSADIINTNRARRSHTEKTAEREEILHHDKTGKLSCTTKGNTETYDLCDCLDPECGGCQWQCETCSSHKCLVGCRQNRKEMIVKIEEMYTPLGSQGHEVKKNPYFNHTNKH